MADNFNYFAEIDLDTRSAYSSLEELNKALGRLEKTSGISEEAIARFKNESERLSDGLRTVATAAKSTDKTMQKIAQGSIKAYTKQLEEMARAANTLQAGSAEAAIKTPKQKKEISDEKVEKQAQAAEDRKAEAEQKKRERRIEQESANETRLVERAAREKTRALEREQAQQLASLERHLKQREKFLRDAGVTETDIARRNAEERKRMEDILADQGPGKFQSELGMQARQLQEMQNFQKYLTTISNERYALRDLATSLTAVGVATTGVVGLGVGLAATYERAFADVARTSGATGDAVQQLHDDLLSMSRTMPVAFEDITSVATLAGQLNIASDDIAAFTETVTKFAATTDVTVDAAAMGLGRLAQLTKTPTHEISNLASAIYETGVNSVATESAILSVASQIATTGNLAGFSVTEVIALSSALASLGVQPELARGAMMRIFGDITSAVGQAGDKLDGLASIAGMSASEFADAWAKTPQTAFTALLQGMEKVAASGQNLDGVLRDIGFGNVRDRRVWQLLADNTEVYADALDDTTRAYAENSALAEGYAHVAETLSAKMQMLIQSVKALAVTGLGPLTKVISDVVSTMLSWLDMLNHFASNHAWIATTMSAVAGFAALAGVLALAFAAMAKIRGALLGAITSTDAWSRSITSSTAGVSRFTTAVRYARLQLRGYNVETATSAALSGKTYKQSLAAAQGMATAGRGLVGILGTLARGFLPLAAISGILAAGTAAWKHFNRETERAKELFGEVGASDGLTQAIKSDMAAVDELENVYRKFSATTDGAKEKLEDNETAVRAAFGAHEEGAGSVDTATESLKEQTGVLGDNSRAWLENELIKDEELQKIAKESGDLLKDAGVNLADALSAALESEAGGKDYFEPYIASAKAAIEEVQRLRTEHAVDAPLGSAVSEEDKAIHAELARRYEEASELLLALEKIQATFAATDSHISQSISDAVGKLNLSSLMGDVSEVSDGLDGLGEEAQSAAEELMNLAAVELGNLIDTGAFQENMRDLHEAVVDAGGSFDVLEQEGLDAMRTLERVVNDAATSAGDNVGLFSQHLIDIYANLEGAGANMGSEVDWLREMLVNTFNQTWGLDLDISNAKGSIIDFINAAIAAIQARAELERATVAMANQGPVPTPFSGKPTKKNSMSTLLTGEDPFMKAQQEQRKENAKAATQNLAQLDQQLAAMEQLKKSVTNVSHAARDNAKAYRDKTAGTKKDTKAAKDNSKANKEAAQEIRTLADYASDLNTVWQRAFDLRYGLQNAKDSTTELTRTIIERFEAAEKAVRDARDSIRALKADLQSLAADRRIKEYQLKVAIEYGDDLRATQLRAELAENNAEAAEKSNQLKDAEKSLKTAQDETTRSLVGNSAATIKNRADVQQLITSYQAQLTALANSGLSTKELERRTAELRAEFVKQLTQMGFNRKEVEKYAKSFDDMAVVIRKLPKRVTVGANTNPAIQALNEFLSKARKSSANVKLNASMPSNIGATGGTYRPSSIYSTGGLSVASVNERKGKSGGGGALLNAHYSTGGQVAYRASGGAIGGLHPGRPKGSDTVPAWLTPEEFVHNRQAVRYYGLPFMNAINEMRLPRYLASGGSAGRGGGGGTAIASGVELGPRTIRAITQALNIELQVDNRALANSVNGANTNSSRRGY